MVFRIHAGQLNVTGLSCTQQQLLVLRIHSFHEKYQSGTKPKIKKKSDIDQDRGRIDNTWDQLSRMRTTPRKVIQPVFN